ncbi:MAG: BlaI/MecI/CopY family transcriptional regulator [Bacteroidia bacterium]|nr:BlaI/MecI/CopY family transcriptional regulator [Bacteroidia bacterium]
MNSSKPTESELDILQVLWNHGPNSVRYVHNIINEAKDVGYTTVLKQMQIMSEKGLLSRDTSQRSHIYAASNGEQETKSGLLEKFIKNTFKGSPMQLVMKTLGDYEPSANELKEIKNLIQNLENK